MTCLGIKQSDRPPATTRDKPCYAEAAFSCDCNMTLRGKRTQTEGVRCCGAAPAGTTNGATQAVPAQAAPAAGGHRASSGTIAGVSAFHPSCLSSQAAGKKGCQRG